MSSPSQPPAGPAPTAVLLTRLAVALKMAQVHDISNAVLDGPLVGLAESLHAVSEGGGETLIDLVADSFFVNKALVRVTPQLLDVMDTLRRIFGRMAVQRLAVERGVTAAGLRELLADFQAHWRSATPAAIKDAPVRHGRFAALGTADMASVALSGGAMIDPRQAVLTAFARLAVIAGEVVGRFSAGESPVAPHHRRAVQSLVDASRGHDALLAGLTRFPSLRGKVENHLAATAAYVLLMARRLNLPKAVLTDVVLSALCHDVGRAAAHDAEDLEARERTAFRAPVASLQSLLTGAEAADSAWLAVAAFETPLSASQEGAWAPGVLARLIAVPCAFDLLTSPLTPRRAMAPDQALRIVQQHAGQRFDARVVQLFTDVVGTYPVGSTVLLSNGWLAVVVEVPPGPGAFNRPLVRVVRDDRGPTSYVLDLTSDPRGLTVSEAVDAVEHGVNPTFFLLA